MSNTETVTFPDDSVGPDPRANVRTNYITTESTMPMLVCNLPYDPNIEFKHSNITRLYQQVFTFHADLNDQLKGDLLQYFKFCDMYSHLHEFERLKREYLQIQSEVSMLIDEFSINQRLYDLTLIVPKELKEKFYVIVEHFEQSDIQLKKQLYTYLCKWADLHGKPEFKEKHREMLKAMPLLKRELQEFIIISKIEAMWENKEYNASGCYVLEPVLKVAIPRSHNSTASSTMKTDAGAEFKKPMKSGVVLETSRSHNSRVISTMHPDAKSKKPRKSGVVLETSRSHNSRVILTMDPGAEFKKSRKSGVVLETSRSDNSRVISTMDPGAEFKKSRKSGVVLETSRNDNSRVILTMDPGAEFKKSRKSGVVLETSRNDNSRVISTMDPGAEFKKPRKSGVVLETSRSHNSRVISTMDPGAEFKKSRKSGVVLETSRSDNSRVISTIKTEAKPKKAKKTGLKSFFRDQFKSCCGGLQQAVYEDIDSVF